MFEVAPHCWHLGFGGVVVTFLRYVELKEDLLNAFYAFSCMGDS